MDERLNADFTRPVCVRTAGMEWQPSPAAGVHRKRLELSGPVESGRVTSVVRYAAGSRFASHGHPDGEEILVLEGVFEDEHGSYPAGTFLLNPQGFSHAPRSGDGCTLFVKLRQYPGRDRRHVQIRTHELAWQAGEGAGIEHIPLYTEASRPESIALLRLAADASWRGQTPAGGEELFVLEGVLESGGRTFGAGDWLRLPAGTRFERRSPAGCRLYVKRGHLPEVPGEDS